jgi:hypothetical protein
MSRGGEERKSELTITIQKKKGRESTESHLT